jgi:hypothetical protein
MRKESRKSFLNFTGLSLTKAFAFAAAKSESFADPPPLNTWLHVTIQSPTSPGGTVRATWTAAEGVAGTRYAQTIINAVEASVQAQATFVGGAALGDGGTARFQYVRARTGYLADATVNGHRQDTGATSGGWAFWWRFFDDGGALGVQDVTGNNRVPTLTGGTFATGPVVPSAG